MTKSIIIISLLIFVAFTSNSCKKTTESELMNGLWKLNSAYLDTSGTNYLNRFPNFGSSYCAYKLSFQESDIVIGYYISNDSILRIVTGTWNVPAYSQVYVKVDSFIDGTFNISRPSLTHWDLTTNYNHIAAFDHGVNTQFDTSYTKLDMTKL